MAPGWGAENVGNPQGTLGRALIVPGGDGIQDRRGVPWASVADGSLLLSSTLGLAAKGGEEGRQRWKKGGGRRNGGTEGERPALSIRPSVLPNHEERVTYEEIMHSGPGLPHPCPCGRLWKVFHSERKEVYVTRVSTRTFWCALGGLLLPLHPPLALWPPGPGQMRVVPSPPTVGVQKGHKAMGRDTLTLSCQGLPFGSQMSRAFHRSTVLRTSGVPESQDSECTRYIKPASSSANELSHASRHV